MTSSHEEPTKQSVILKSLNDNNIIEVFSEVVVGRGANCDAVINQAHLSRHHAKLRRIDGSLQVEDLGSTNGTYLNDQKLTDPAYADHGDIIRFDSLPYRVCIVGTVDDVDDTVYRGETLANKGDKTLNHMTKELTPPGNWALDKNPDTEPTMRLSPGLHRDSQFVTDPHHAECIEIITPLLVGLSGKTRGKTFKITPYNNQPPWTIGRSVDCDILIDDGSVSATHAQLFHEKTTWKLIDNASVNGTYINDRPITSRNLNSEDKVRFGQVEFVFKLEDDDHTPEASDKQLLGNWTLLILGFGVTALFLYLLFF